MVDVTVSGSNRYICWKSIHEETSSEKICTQEEIHAEIIQKTKTVSKLRLLHKLPKVHDVDPSDTVQSDMPTSSR